MSEKKYEICKDKTIVINGITLYQIRALHEVDVIRANLFKTEVVRGTYGGYIENESNLSQSGRCWIDPESCVMNDARIIDNARVCGKSVVAGNSIIEQGAVVKDSKILESSIIRGNASIQNSYVCGKSIIGGLTTVEGETLGSITITGDIYMNPSNPVVISGDFAISGRMAID